MSEITERETLTGWRKQFATLYRLCRGISADSLEKVTVGLIMLLIMMLPVEMIMRMLSRVAVYNMVYGIWGAAIVITALVWLGKRILVPEDFARPQWTLCDAALLAMLGWSVLSTLASPDPLACFRGNVQRNEGLATYFIYSCVYLLLRNCCGRENIRRILICFVSSVSAMCVLSLFCLPPCSGFMSNLLGKSEYNTIHLGVCGAFNNQNHYSYMMGMSTVITATLYISEHNRRRKTVYAAVYVLLVHMMIQNESLGGFVAAAIGLVAYLVVACIRTDLQPRKALMLLIVFAAVAGISSYSTGRELSTDVMDVMGSVLEVDENVSTTFVRRNMWKKALLYIAQRPVLGYGPDGSGIVIFVDTFGVNTRPHNEYLQYAVFLGIPGLAMYLTAMGSLLVRLLQRLHNLSPLSVIMACAVLTYCASAFVGNSMYYTTVYYVAILAMLVKESGYRYPETPETAAR